MAITCSFFKYLQWRTVCCEKLAERLGYSIFSHEDVIDDLVSGNGSADKVRKALQHAPSFLERFTYDKERELSVSEPLSCSGFSGTT